jgi:uncharacterized protein YecT (DUF1311 family)
LRYKSDIITPLQFMKTLTSTLVLLGTFIFSLAASAQTKVTPTDWYPALAPSIRFALEKLKEANSTAEMNSLSRQIADMTDAQLYIAYVRLYERLNAKERAALSTEQAKWLKARSKAATDGIESEGGSLAPIEANNAEVTFTEKRLAELRRRLKATNASKSDE